jgi:hypothetical protein
MTNHTKQSINTVWPHWKKDGDIASNFINGHRQKEQLTKAGGGGARWREAEKKKKKVPCVKQPYNFKRFRKIAKSDY